MWFITKNQLICNPLAASKCSDDRLKPFNGTCYLFVSYPEVDWFTAQQVCAGIHGELASVTTAEEQRYTDRCIIQFYPFIKINFMSLTEQK